jgi:hypothetical protein
MVDTQRFASRAESLHKLAAPPKSIQGNDMEITEQCGFNFTGAWNIV